MHIPFSYYFFYQIQWINRDLKVVFFEINFILGESLQMKDTLKIETIS